MSSSMFSIVTTKCTIQGIMDNLNHLGEDLISFVFVKINSQSEILISSWIVLTLKVLTCKIIETTLNLCYGQTYFPKGWIFLFLIFFKTHNYFTKIKNKTHKNGLSGIWTSDPWNGKQRWRALDHATLPCRGLFW